MTTTFSSTITKAIAVIVPAIAVVFVIIATDGIPAATVITTTGTSLMCLHTSSLLLGFCLP